MRKIAAPNIDVREFYLECARDTSDVEQRARLVATVDAIVSAADSYEQAGGTRRWFELPNSIQDVPASDAELRGLYDRVMVRQGRVGRHVYNLIFSSSGVCPMCGQGKVSTLDHYLPKSRYAQYSIFAKNLVPCCRDCNTEKRVLVAASAGDQAFHPYFDDVEGDQWLFANLGVGGAVSLSYFVEPPATWSVTLAERARSHFMHFRLDVLFSTFAATELSSLKYRLQKMFLIGGADSVRADLQLEAESARHANVNSWKTAMYDALRSNAAFCAGGFDAIGA
ncbi:HNH endonuclease [Undibacter mobilis]|uniref:HNH endonuclease n=1 Tax=Undibacter mobilis TaxID=2292256 RepID=A0A371BCE0_9BRAD|nr:HNH endonuclease [Undibacter mobilis]RDV05220.1 HNH endonuclease [Undibacter mobilis]